MPQLKAYTADIKQFYLPSTAKDENGNDVPTSEQAWVKMDVGEVTGGEVIEVVNEDGLTPGKVAINMLTERIKEWNFTTPDGQTEAITVANVRRMDAGDLGYLVQKLAGAAKLGGQQLSDDQKKS
jgi:hypothetical protein